MTMHFVNEYNIVNTAVNSTESIVSAVERYTTDKERQAFLAIVNSSDSDERKRQRLMEYYHYNNRTDLADRISILMDSLDEAQQYNGLMADENYMSWYYYDYLNNTPKGKAARVSLVLSGLVFNNELSDWINFTTYTDLEFPGVKKYKSMLEDFVKKNSSEIEFYNYVKETEKFVNSSVGIWSDLEKGKILKSLADVADIKNEMTYKSKFNNFLVQSINTKDGKKKLCVFDGKNKPKFIEALDLADKFFSGATITEQFVMDMMDISSNIETYETYHKFLQDIYNASDISSFELKIAAKLLDDELANAYITPVTNLLKEVRNIIFENGLSEVGLDKVDSLMKSGGYLAAVKFTAFCINQLVDIGDLVKNSCQTEGYVLLANHYKNKLKSCE